MKALVCVEPGKLEYQNVKEPEVSKDEVLVKIKRIGICGTDLHAFEGTQPFFSYPRILGHELTCEIIEGKDLNGCEVGDLTTFIPYFSCGKCIACRSGKSNCCADLKVCGVHVDGGMREYLTVPSYSILPTPGIEPDELALIEPLSIGAHAVRRAEIKPGEFALVIGAGPIGLGIAEFARLEGAKVIVMDVNTSRLQFSKRMSDIIQTVMAGEDAIRAIEELTDGDMPTVVFDATGNRKAILEGFRYIAHGGRYVLVGLQKGEVSFSHPDFHKREAAVMSSRNATREDFETVVSAIRSKSIVPTNMITHAVRFDELGKAFPGWLDPAAGVIKAIVEL